MADNLAIWATVRTGVPWIGISLVLAACTSLQPPTASADVQPSSAQAATSWKDRRERNVVMQQSDYSCGAASLATLLRHCYGDTNATEAAIIEEIWTRLSDEDVADRQAHGLSMLDLREHARRRGYAAEGLALSPADLEQLSGPVLVHMIRDGLPHFAVLRGIRGDKTFLADPSCGNLTLQTASFVNEWSGYVLCLDKPGFALRPDHPLALDAGSATSAPRFRKQAVDQERP